MNCEQGHDQQLAERYVAGELTAEEIDAFEQHYFECDACLAAVEFGQAMKSGAAAEASQAGSPKVIAMPARQPPKKPYWIHGAVAAAALVAVTFGGWRAFTNFDKPMSDTARSAPANPAEPKPASAAAQPDAGPQLIASNAVPDAGAVDPLAYRPAVLRGGSEDSSQRFRQVMSAYQSHDYRKAAVGLSSIPVGVPGSGKPEDHITDAGVQLFLGISRLMLNENGEAVVALRRAVEYGDTPYLENSGYYLAKGLIRQKQYSGAAQQLRQTIALNGDRQRDAQQLLEQVNALLAK